MLNQYQQEIGEQLSDITPRPRPTIQSLEGHYTRLERLNIRHSPDLISVYGPQANPANFTYLSTTPCQTDEEVSKVIAQMAAQQDPYHLAILDKSNGKALGTLAIMRADPLNHTIEIGFVCYGEQLKKSRIATEAQYLAIKYIFEQLGYRRLEWKCDSLNTPSRKAAQRLGFTYEGTFRQAIIYKGRNRDTAWFSMLDKEWLHLKKKFEKWLSPSNFDKNGQQLCHLEEC